jgi:hypothetical protein
MIACLIGIQRNESKGETNVRLRINSGIKAITENESRGGELDRPRSSIVFEPMLEGERPFVHSRT